MRNPVKTAKRQLLRVGSCALSALMVLGSIPAAAIGDGVTATYDEAYYAMTDYYGNLTDGSVVKSYRTNGIATLTDYGDYDEIINLTDGTVPARNGGMTTFRLDEKALPGTFYFEGKTTKFQQFFCLFPDFFPGHKVQPSLIFHHLIHRHVLTHGILLGNDTDLSFQSGIFP